MELPPSHAKPKNRQMGQRKIIVLKKIILAKKWFGK
jgi:hypothetical protein